MRRERGGRRRRTSFTEREWKREAGRESGLGLPAGTRACAERRYQLRSNAADGRSWRRRARGSKFAIPLTFLHFLACVGGRASALESK